MYKEPQKPKKGRKKIKQEVLACVSARAIYFPNGNEDEYEYEDEEHFLLKLKQQSISLKDVNALIQKKGIDQKNVFFTASFADDYLVLEIVSRKELSYAEQLIEYQEDCIQWEYQVEEQKERELLDTNREIERLQKQAELLKKKKF